MSAACLGFFATHPLGRHVSCFASLTPVRVVANLPELRIVNRGRNRLRGSSD